jgi:small subunit ribosomal protein S14
MAKKSIIEREKKRFVLVNKYAQKREDLKHKIKYAIKMKERLYFQFKLQKLSRNSSKTRIRNRCMETGRPRGYYRDFGLSRHNLREMAHKGLLPGITKASW